MRISTTTRFALLAFTLAITILWSREIKAYMTNGRWALSEVAYLVNAQNLDVAQPAAEAAVRAGGDTWASQSRAAFRFVFGGTSTQTTTTNDGRNLIVFRNASNGSAIATTYWWSNSSGIIDADIVFWDAAFLFFAGSSGCSGGFYVEDIAAHEFGHALGLGHSTSTTATMYPTTPSCSMRNRTLDPDDVAGVEALYPPRATPGAPTGFRLNRSGV
jgi:matrixin